MCDDSHWFKYELWRKENQIRALQVIKLLGGFALVYHGWTEPNLYPFLFGLWVLFDARFTVRS